VGAGGMGVEVLSHTHIAHAQQHVMSTENQPMDEFRGLAHSREGVAKRTRQVRHC
jgi:hypothetical protein